MAHLEPFGYEGLVKMDQGINSLAVDTDVVAQTCINAASPTMEAIYKSIMAGAAPQLSGAASSSATTPAKMNYLGDYAVTRPIGWNPNSSGGDPRFAAWRAKSPPIRYGMLAALFNYGVGSHVINFSRPNKFGRTKFRAYGSDEHPGMNVSGQGWHDRAASAAEGPVTKLVEEKFDSEIKRLFGQ